MKGSHLYQNKELLDDITEGLNWISINTTRTYHNVITGGIGK